MSMLWTAIGTTAVGLGTSLYGANRQRQDNAHALDVNKATQDQQNAAQWTNWLMSKGVAPTSPVAAGVMPTADNYTAVNTRLPLWANVNSPTTAVASTRASTPLFIKRT